MKKIITLAVAALCAMFTAAAIALCAIFPNKYAAELNAAADEFGLDRTLVRSVVWTESRFDRYATSGKGAKGLMQLLPQTFLSCAEQLGITDAPQKVFDPYTSLRCGCYYLALMLKRFNGNITAALMAYNAGEANAKKFLSGELKVFPETAEYLKSIKKASLVYGFGVDK